MLSFLKFFRQICLFSFVSLVLISCEPFDNFSFPWRQKQVVEESTENYIFYPVKWISDGDTFWIDDGTKSGKKIRMIGIDAPESVDYGNKIKHKLGEEAHKYLDSLLKGKKVRLTYDIVKYDKYGRTLAYVFLEDDTFVNRKMVEMGYAVSFTYPPNLKYTDEFNIAEDSAIYYNRGLWVLESNND